MRVKRCKVFKRWLGVSPGDRSTLGLGAQTRCQPLAVEEEKAESRLDPVVPSQTSRTVGRHGSGLPEVASGWFVPML
jgi:hypothetical protein